MFKSRNKLTLAIASVILVVLIGAAILYFIKYRKEGYDKLYYHKHRYYVIVKSKTHDLYIYHVNQFGNDDPIIYTYGQQYLRNFSSLKYGSKEMTYKVINKKDGSVFTQGSFMPMSFFGNYNPDDHTLNDAGYKRLNIILDQMLNVNINIQTGPIVIPMNVTVKNNSSIKYYITDGNYVQKHYATLTPGEEKSIILDADGTGYYVMPDKNAPEDTHWFKPGTYFKDYSSLYIVISDDKNNVKFIGIN